MRCLKKTIHQSATRNCNGYLIIIGVHDSLDYIILSFDFSYFHKPVSKKEFSGYFIIDTAFDISYSGCSERL